MSFSLLLVIAVVVTGVVWLLDKLVLRKRRTPVEGGQAGKDPWYVDYSKSFFPVLLIVLIVRSFIVEPFQIPSGSMRPTLKIGDYIVVNKFTYGLRLPVVNTKILDVSEPERGDIMVFRFPGDPNVDFIKRVIGLPGDTIRYENKQLFVNGEPVPKSLLEADAPDNAGEKLLEEQLGDVSHRIYNNPADPGPQVGTIEVPPGHYFMMGDNRDHSNDSRYWGFVPEENIVGKAFAVWMHWPDGLPDFTKARLLH
ncbi:signal peptidase I [Larsenimonas salina]|uniref:signal peptidase I n=1 Tax=Larsenimonas salina TaxID=1295565 RepID=UPI002073C5DF|nr:signal peptidase I [Larsenimonas salina]MCM5703257.1 signal peptidase I [Larsenimonas salina]